MKKSRWGYLKGDNGRFVKWPKNSEPIKEWEIWLLVGMAFIAGICAGSLLDALKILR